MPDLPGKNRAYAGVWFCPIYILRKEERVMRKTLKRVLACTLAAALALGTAVTSMAADSPVAPAKKPEKQTNVITDSRFYTVNTTTKGTITITASKATSRAKKTVAAKLKVNGVKYTVTTIGPSAFAKWKKVKSIYLPAGVKTIKANAFKGCKSLTTIVLKNKKAATVKKNAFKGLNTKKITIKVKAKMSAKNYKKLQLNLRKAGFKGKIKKAS